MSKLVLLIVTISLFLATIYISSAQLTTVIDGYVLNVSGNGFQGVDVSMYLNPCSGPGCSGTHNGTYADGYYAINNVAFCLSGMMVYVSATYPGGWHGNNSKLCTGGNTKINITLGRDPSPPALTDQVNTHNTSVSLAWTSNATRGQPAPNGGAVYDTFYFDGTPTYNATPPISKSSLAMFSSHTWGVKSCDSWGFCSAQITDSFSIINTKPNSPVLVDQPNTHDTNVSLSWTSNKTRGQTDDDGDTLIDDFYWQGTWYTNQAPSQAKSGLVMGTTYTWGARTCDVYECSTPVYDTFTVQNNAPPAPNITDVPHTQLTSITFQWINYSDPEGDSTYNRFQLATDSGFGTIISSDYNATSPIILSMPSVFTLYYWRVQTCDSFGQCSAWSTDSFFVYECAACPTCPTCGGTTCPECPSSPSCPECEVCPEPEPECVSDWQCGDWGVCNEEGLSFRQCNDAGGCIDMGQVPSLKQGCSYTPPQCEANVTIIEKEKIVEQPVVVQEIQKIFGIQKENITTTITKEIVKISDVVSCSAEWIGRITSVEDTGFIMPEGTVKVIKPFKVDCISGKAVVSVNVPDRYSSVQALRCDQKGDCVSVPLKQLDSYTCPIILASGEEQLSRDSATSALRNIPTKTATLNSVENSVTVNEYKALFSGISSLSLTVRRGVELASDEDKLKMISGQFELDFIDDIPPGVAINVTLPYVKRDIDENTIAVYVRNFRKGASAWDLLRGTVDPERNVITASLRNPKDYLTAQKKIVFSVMAVDCPTCGGVELKNVYNPIPLTKDAVILVHGFGSTASTFDPLISDIKITNQPWQLWTFGYPTDGSIDFNDLATKLADKIEEQSDSFENVYIVSHSLGGLVTQKAIRYAYERNKIRAGSYSFVSKVNKIVLIGSPNKGSPGAQVYDHFVEYIKGKQQQSPDYAPRKEIINLLTKGMNIPKVPGIKYYVIAGTKPYDVVSSRLFGEQPNDGVVSTDSATFVGGEYINDRCTNYWEIGTDHNDLLKNPISRKVIGKIIASQVASTMGNSDLIGLTSFYEMNDASCSNSSTYIIVGRDVIPEKMADPTMCSCGNGYCGEGENEVNCPQDCATFFREENVCVVLLFIIMIASVLFSIFLVIAVHRMYSLNSFSNIAIVPLIFILISIFSMILYVTKGCYVVFMYRMLTIIIAVASIALAILFVAIIIAKNKIRMYLLRLRRKEDLRRLEDYIYTSIRKNEETIQKKLLRVGWRTEDIAYIVRKAKKKAK